MPVHPGRNVKLPAGPLLRALPARLEGSSSRWRWAVQRARREGIVSVIMADELCIGILGRHPAEIYGDEWGAE